MADPEEVLRWKTKADSDYTAANDLLKANSTSTDAICFHCQQAVEKYLKAMLIACGKEFQKTHDLSVLAEMLAAKYPDLVDFREDFSRLTFYAVDARYPDDDFTPGIEEAKNAFDNAKAIKKIFDKSMKHKRK